MMKAESMQLNTVGDILLAGCVGWVLHLLGSFETSGPLITLFLQMIVAIPTALKICLDIRDRLRKKSRSGSGKKGRDGAET